MSCATPRILGYMHSVPLAADAESRRGNNGKRLLSVLLRSRLKGVDREKEVESSTTTRVDSFPFTSVTTTTTATTATLHTFSMEHRRTSTSGSIKFATPPLLCRTPSHDPPDHQQQQQLPLPDPLKRSRSPPSSLTNYSPRVGFDIFNSKDFSGFTLRAKHVDFKYSRRSRTFLVGTDQNDYSESAIDWLIEALAEDGDEIVILRVVEPGSKLAESIEAGGEPSYRRAAREILRSTMVRGDEDKAFDLVVEFHVGKVQDKLLEMIEIYHPDSLVVGSRGRDKGIQSLLPGSISKFCLQHSPVPVIVVRPDRKRQKRKKKRQQDPTRQSYIEILQNSIGGAETFLELKDDDEDLEILKDRRVQHMKSAPEILSKSNGNVD